MSKQSKLRKALDTIALKHSEGIVSNDLLVKACENYKNAIGFEDDFSYQLLVAKTCFDFINGVDADPNLVKAVLPGQTKVIDGVMYIYSKTAAGSKTEYAWHVARSLKTGQIVGRGGVLNNTSVDKKQAYINELFPVDTSSLKEVKKLGGSTGATLVEDVNGNKYVKKTSGGMLSPEALKNEYKANQVYDLLGVRVPDYELYEEDNGEVTLLSRFISGFTPVNKFSTEDERKKLAEHTIADVLLANWDIYCNDNCNLDLAGRVVRVDNGSTFNFRAQGGKKIYDSNVLKTFQDMAGFSPSIFDLLSIDDIKKQIADIVAKKDYVVNYLNQSNEPTTAKIIGQRIDNLNTIVDYLESQQVPQILPRDLKDPKEMYREFTEEEIQEFWDNADGSDYRAKINKTNDTVGWELLGEVLKARGFDARPRVVDDKTYWDAVAKSKYPQIIRGVNDGYASKGITIDYQKKHFKYNDTFYSGRYGIYGSGLYAHVNDGHLYGTKTDNTPTGYKNSQAYSNAMGYSGGNPNGIILMALEDDFKMIKLQDLIKEVKEDAKNFGTPTDVKKIKELGKKETELGEEIKKLDEDINDLTYNSKQKIEQSMGYDSAAVSDMFTTIDNTNWGQINSEGELLFPKFDEIVTKDFADWVRKNGGKADEQHGQLTFSLPHSDNEFIIRRKQWDDTNTIRRRTPMSAAYHIIAERFKNWFTTNHIEIVKERVQEELDNLGDKLTKLKDEKSKKDKEYRDVVSEKKKLMTPDPNGNIYQGALAYQNGYEDQSEGLGIIAAMKGYDGIYQPNGNSTGNGFLIILNRSKVIVKQ